MLTRWIIRLSVFATLLLTAVLAGAAPPSSGGTASPGGGGDRGGSAPPAKGAAPTPAPPSGGGGSSGGSSSSSGASKPPTPTPPPSQPPVTPPRSATGQPTNPNSPLPPTPRTAAELERQHQQRTAAEEQQRQRGQNGTPTTGTPTTGPSSIIVGGYPRSLYGWAPYNMWWSGNSYWLPPLDGSYDSGTYDRGYDDGSTVRSTPPVPTLPPDTSTPGKDQARALNALEASPDYRLAVSDLQKAQADLDSAMDRIRAKLKENPQYKALIDERDGLQEKVEAVQASAKIPSAAQVTPVAQRKLDLSGKITRMERDAIAADPQAQAAQKRVDIANARVTAMRQAVRGAQ